MVKKQYSGLKTKRSTVENEPIMATSNSKIKVKTGVSSNEDWVEKDVSTPLESSITSEISF